jgi:hypothetical protein
MTPEQARDRIRQRAATKSEKHGKPAAPVAPVTPASTAPVVVPPYKPFPVEVLPSVLRDFVGEASESVDCDAAFAALPALTLVGAAAGASVAVSPKRRFREVPALWACTVGDSGTGKSPGMAPAADVAFAIDKQLKSQFDAKYAQYECDLAQWKDDPEENDRPLKPCREYFAVVDATIERLAEMLGGSRRGLMLVRDELAGWFGSFVRYKSKGGTDVPNWLSMFDAGPIRVHRRTGEPRDIETDRGFVAVLGGIQPDILRQMLSDPGYVSSGLAARIVFSAPPKACPRWSDAELSQATEDAFIRVIQTIRGIPFSPALGPEIILLEPAALARFKRLNNEFAEQAEGLEGGPMAAALPKAIRYALRLALIHHLVERTTSGQEPHKGPLTIESMEAGEALARWFVAEASRVYAMLAERPEDRSARNLADLVRRKGGRVRPRDLQRANLAKYPTSSIAELALDALVSAGLGDWVEEPPSAKGGPANRIFVLHPQPDTRHYPTQPLEVGSALPDTPPDTTSDTHTETPRFPGEKPVVSGSVGCRVGCHEGRTPPGMSGSLSGVVSGALSGDVEADGQPEVGVL